MDATRFTEQKTGKLIRIQLREGSDWAFVPAPLPPLWDFDRSGLWPLLAEAREMLARLDEKGRTVPNPTLLLDPLQKREALRSSSLEGTFATAKELLLFELDPRPAAAPDESREREVWNYDQALRFGVKNLRNQNGLPLSKRLIAEMHRILMTGVRGNDQSAGQFRTRQVHVGSDRRYIPPPPGDPLMKCLNDLDLYLGNHETTYHPLVLSYLVHYQFESIHPFLDGNGRIGRLLLALTTYEWSDLALPWLYMSAYFERYKSEYVDNLFRVSTDGDWGKWIEFCLRGTVEQCHDAIRRCDALNALRAEMHQRLDGYPRMGALIDSIFIQPVFTASAIARWGGGTSMPTARRDIEQLMEAGYAVYLSGDRPRRYYVPKVFNAAYFEPDEAVEPEAPTSEPPTPDETSGAS